MSRARSWNWSEVDDRLLRVIIRWNGRATHVAYYVGCTQRQALKRAIALGMRFGRPRSHQGAA